MLGCWDKHFGLTFCSNWGLAFAFLTLLIIIVFGPSFFLEWQSLNYYARFESLETDSQHWSNHVCILLLWSRFGDGFLWQMYSYTASRCHIRATEHSYDFSCASSAAFFYGCVCSRLRWSRMCCWLNDARHISSPQRVHYDLLKKLEVLETRR